MHIVYIDDSGDETTFILSALAISDDLWQETFQAVKQFRQDLKKSDGIFVHKELHAWKFISGRGAISDHIVPKGRRCQLFKETLRTIAKLPNVKLFNAVFPAGQKARTFERLLNRINRAMDDWDSRAILICDEGDEVLYTRLARKMRIYNPIPSMYGTWGETGSDWKNIPIDRILEDPFFKKSERSYFIQLADFCAYALLRRENPIASKTKYGLDKAFELLVPILMLEANKNDPRGIIRP
jgi:hypothetical protein